MSASGQPRRYPISSTRVTAISAADLGSLPDVGGLSGARRDGATYGAPTPAPRVPQRPITVEGIELPQPRARVSAKVRPHTKETEQRPDGAGRSDSPGWTDEPDWAARPDRTRSDARPKLPRHITRDLPAQTQTRQTRGSERVSQHGMRDYHHARARFFETFGGLDPVSAQQTAITQQLGRPSSTTGPPPVTLRAPERVRSTRHIEVSLGAGTVLAIVGLVLVILAFSRFGFGPAASTATPATATESVTERATEPATPASASLVVPAPPERGDP